MEQQLTCTKELRMAFTEGKTYPVLDQDDLYYVVKDDTQRTHFISKQGFSEEYFG